MNVRAMVAVGVIVIGMVAGVVTFTQSTIDYASFSEAQRSKKKVQVKGEWVRERSSNFDATKTQFSFFMKDDEQQIMKVVLDGAMPNNFELASSVVVKGRMQSDYFHATEILTKCPSKYEGDSTAVRKSL
jgi:cytochrome c-type biogenesis protein CcmE